MNRPFRGGHIIQKQSSVIPWIQLEVSRSPDFTDEEKGERVLRALREFSQRTFGAVA